MLTPDNEHMSGPMLVVFDVIHPSPHPFAVLSVDPAKRNEDGEVIGIVVSLHMTREEADRVVLSGSSTGTRQ
jgi:hypothetical protein